MAKRYRVYWVDSNETTLKDKLLFDIPDVYNNNIQYTRLDESNNVTTAGGVASWIEAHGNGTISGFNSNILWAKEGSSTMIDDFCNKGFSNYIDLTRLEVGDKFYLGRWDHSHSYFVYNGRSAGMCRFTGYTSDGTLVYQEFLAMQLVNFGTRFETQTFPFLYNWNSGSDYGLYVVNPGMFADGRFYQFTFSKIRLPISTALAESMWSNVPIIDTDNPYEGGGESGEGGGDEDRQNWDNASDAVTPDALPTKGAMHSGMLKVFSPTETQVLDLTDLLFSYNFFDWLQKNLQNLEELFVSFGVVPFTVTKGATKSVTFLGFDISSFTHPVYLTEASQQYYEFNMGSIALNGSDSRIHASDSVFDYSPFSRLGIYLPFIGFQELNIDECRGNTINLRYRIDIISGSAVALIYLNNDDEHCIYQFSGNCLSQIPLGSVDMSGIVSGSINIAVAAASAGTSGAIASAGDAMIEGFAGDNMSATQKEYQHAQNAARVSDANGHLASATANGIMGMKPNYKHSGAIGSTGGLMAVKQPYLFLTTPREAVPASYQKYCGLPCNITDTLGNFRGYTVVEDIRLNGLVATSAEVEEIYNLLKSGVII